MAAAAPTTTRSPIKSSEPENRLDSQAEFDSAFEALNSVLEQARRPFSGWQLICTGRAGQLASGEVWDMGCSGPLTEEEWLYCVEAGVLTRPVHDPACEPPRWGEGWHCGIGGDWSRHLSQFTWNITQTSVCLAESERNTRRYAPLSRSKTWPGWGSPFDYPSSYATLQVTFFQTPLLAESFFLSATRDPVFFNHGREIGSHVVSYEAVVPPTVWPLRGPGPSLGGYFHPWDYGRFLEVAEIPMGPEGTRAHVSELSLDPDRHPEPHFRPFLREVVAVHRIGNCVLAFRMSDWNTRARQETFLADTTRLTEKVAKEFFAEETGPLEFCEG